MTSVAVQKQHRIYTYMRFKDDAIVAIQKGFAQKLLERITVFAKYCKVVQEALLDDEAPFLNICIFKETKHSLFC